MNFRSVRLAFLIALEYAKRKWFLILAGAGAVAVLIVLQIVFNFFYSPNILRIGLIGTYQEHDLPPEILKLVSEGLVYADNESRIKPDLAAGWETNNDATEFRFRLKENLRWSDGSLIRAQDIEFSIPNAEIQYPDDKTIRFKLRESYSPFPSLLTKPVLKKGTLLGTGPYSIAKVEKSRIFITKLIMQPKKEGLPLIYARFYPSEKVAVTGFQLGEVQAILGIGNPGSVGENSSIILKQKTDYSKIVSVLYQTGDPLLGSRSLRQALSYQIPAPENEEIANNPYPPYSWAYDENAKKYFSNEVEAKEAMERAESGMSKEKMGSELILTVTPALSDLGKNIVAAWRKLGFDVKLRIESGIPQNFQALLITQSIPSDPDQYFLWHATQKKTNLSKYDSKRADKNLEDGRKLIKEDERKAKYFDFQKTLLEDAPAAFLYFPKYSIVYLKKVAPLMERIIAHLGD